MPPGSALRFRKSGSSHSSAHRTRPRSASRASTARMEITPVAGSLEPAPHPCHRMREQDLIRAILESPEDDAPRLAYASWLDAQGQRDRAEWIRLSCRFATLAFDDPDRQPLLLTILDHFRRCRPQWWEELSSVNQYNERGMYRFAVGSAPSSRSATTYKRLGNTAWLATAADEGWLERLE